MSGHIVRPLKGVTVVRRVLRHGVVEMRFEIRPNGGICVFVKRQTRRCVFDEYLRNAGSNLAHLLSPC